MRSVLRCFSQLNSNTARIVPRYIEPVQFENFCKALLTEPKPNYVFLQSIFNSSFNKLSKYPKNTVNKINNYYCEFLKSDPICSLDINAYNSLLFNYILNDIDFNINGVIETMIHNKIQPNENTCELLLLLYSEKVDFKSIQNLIDKTKFTNLKLSTKAYHYIYCGYIRARKFEEAEQFLKANKFNKDSINLLMRLTTAYADIGDCEKVIDIFKSISEKKITLVSSYIPDLYRRMVKANSPEPLLDKIIFLGNVTDKPSVLSDLIFTLNRNGFFGHSFKVLNTLRDFVSSENITDLVQSFNTADCPINIYESVLRIFAPFIHSSVSNLFSNMDLATASNIVDRIIDQSNSYSLLANLLATAIKEKSVEKIEHSLMLTKDNMPRKSMHHLAQFVFIRQSLNSAMVSTPSDIINQWPNHAKVLFPNLLMHYLTLGNFETYRALLDEFKMDFVPYCNFSRRNARAIVANIPITSWSLLKEEVEKFFSPYFVNWLMGNIVIEKVIIPGSNNRKEVLKLATSFNVKYSEYDMEYVTKVAPSCRDHFKSFEIINAAPKLEQAYLF